LLELTLELTALRALAIQRLVMRVSAMWELKTPL
jgi:hypothetical protein